MGSARGARLRASAAGVVLAVLAGQPALADAAVPTPATVAHPHEDDGRESGGGWDDDDRRGPGKWEDHPGRGRGKGGRHRGRGRGRGHAGRWDAGPDSADAPWESVVGFAANNGGRGFWVLTRQGRVFALDGAPDLGSVAADGEELVDLVGHPGAAGYWVLSASGRVRAFGAAREHGSRRGRAVGMAPHRSGAGYWIAAPGGRVWAFGAAVHHGDARNLKVVVDDIVAREDADGYVLRTTANAWLPFPQRSHPGKGHGQGRDREDHAGRDDDHGHGGDRPRTKPPREEPRDTTRPPVGDGAVRVVTVRGITVERRIAGQTRRLLRAADRAGVRLGGWGYRSHARQIELRRAHCGTSRYAIYSKPSSACRPPTARPGHSMHEQGLAIDFYKRRRNGQAIAIAGTRAFRWLKRNAARFGFYNLPSEPWHWSTNGR